MSTSIVVWGIFALSVAYAVLGNVIVYVILLRRHVPVSFMWAGTPGYLYRVCVAARVGVCVQRFAFSTNIALGVAMILGVGIGGLQH